MSCFYLFEFCLWFVVCDLSFMVYRLLAGRQVPEILKFFLKSKNLPIIRNLRSTGTINEKL